MVAHYRKPETAPRDGTIIVGLFARRGKRAIALPAAFDLEAAAPVEVKNSDPKWMQDAAAKHEEILQRDPTAFIRPLGEDADTGAEIGRLIGWRPARKYEPGK